MYINFELLRIKISSRTCQKVARSDLRIILIAYYFDIRFVDVIKINLEIHNKAIAKQ